MLRFSVLWLVAGVVLAPFVWGVVSALIGAEALGRSGAFLSNAADAAAWAVASMPLWLPPYAVLLLLWPRFVRRVPAIERGALPIAMCSAAAALPLALIVAVSYLGRIPFAAAFLAPLLSAWICLLLPRMVIPALRPGRFSRGT